jgi:hypothetical protein
MKCIETIPGMGGRRIKENGGECEFNLIYGKNLKIFKNKK